MTFGVGCEILRTMPISPGSCQRHLIAILLILAVMLPPRAGFGNSGRVKLDYRRAANAHFCPEGAALRKAVVTRLGTDPFGAGEEGVIEVHLSRRGTNYRARIVRRSASGELLGERRLAMTSLLCADLIPALALSIALALGPPKKAAPRRRDLRPREGPLRQPRQEIADTLGPFFTTRDFTSVPTRLGLEGRIALIGFVGTAPTPAAGLGLALVARYRAFSLGLELRGHPAIPSPLRQGSLHVSQVDAALMPCWRTGSWGLCLSLVGGFAHAQALGVDAPRTTLTPTFAAGLRVDWRVVRTRKLAVVLFAEGTAAVLRTRLFVGPEEVWSRPPVSAVFGLALDAGL